MEGGRLNSLLLVLLVVVAMAAWHTSEVMRVAGSHLLAPASRKTCSSKAEGMPEQNCATHERQSAINGTAATTISPLPELQPW